MSLSLINVSLVFLSNLGKHVGLDLRKVNPRIS
jgi:hypothetical protein